MSGGTRETEAPADFGSRLGSLGVLPAPFPLEGLLSEVDRRHVRRLYGIGGLSYGNLSVRHSRTAFWMTASGIDKSRMQAVGRDFLLITGLDAAGPTLHVSVPPGLKAPRRASVDAIEHWMIYRTSSGGWSYRPRACVMEGVASTQVNYPCGTIELAGAVADLVGRASDPARAIVGRRTTASRSRVAASRTSSTASKGACSHRCRWRPDLPVGCPPSAVDR